MDFLPLSISWIYLPSLFSPPASSFSLIFLIRVPPFPFLPMNVRLTGKDSLDLSRLDSLSFYPGHFAMPLTPLPRFTGQVAPPRFFPAQKDQSLSPWFPTVARADSVLQTAGICFVFFNLLKAFLEFFFSGSRPGYTMSFFSPAQLIEFLCYWSR